MKKRIVFLVSLAILLALGMAAVSCSDGGGSDPVNGTWINGTHQLILNNGKFEYRVDGSPLRKGTYKTNTMSDGNTGIQLTPTHAWGPYFGTADQSWYDRRELSALGNTTTVLNPMFSTGTGTVAGSRITLKWNGVSEVLTKN